MTALRAPLRARTRRARHSPSNHSNQLSTLIMNKRVETCTREITEQGWTFLTNHAHVLLCIARDPEIRLRDVATAVGITERAAHRIVVDLEAGGYISRERSGRRNRYDVHPDVPLRHPVEQHRTAASLIALLRSERRKE